MTPTDILINRQIQQLKDLAAQVESASRFQRAGMVTEVSGLAIVAQGPPAQIGEVCTLQPPDGDAICAALQC